MHERIKESLTKIDQGVLTSWGETAWPIESLSRLLDVVLQNRWIILGGDVLTLECKHTYSNWYYNPDPQKSLEYNVRCSVEICSMYTRQYVAKNNGNYLFTIVISDSYVAGNC